MQRQRRLALWAWLGLVRNWPRRASMTSLRPRPMKPQLVRETVDLSDYPDLVVLYLGMRVNAFQGLATLLGFRTKISAAVQDAPDGLLAHEPIVYSLFPAHVGMR